ncbi:MAG: SDR family NAD(P)-dependent oxidoreductase [Blastocatellia bacterium]
MENRLQGKTAIVTGGAAGIGRATCELFAEQGAQVVVADLDNKNGKATAAAINKGGGAAIFVRTDIASENDIKRLTAKTLRQFGKLDILVNNAATFVLKGLDATLDDWNRSLSVNVIGTAIMSRYGSDAMKRNQGGKGSGAIVNIGSISGYVAQPEFIAYSASKAAIIQMSRNMAMDLAPYNIRVNTVCPGTIITQASENHCKKLGITLDDFRAECGPLHILNRCGEPREVAQAILFLASDEASFITATDLMVDGGLIGK